MEMKTFPKVIPDRKNYRRSNATHESKITIKCASNVCYAPLKRNGHTFCNSTTYNQLCTLDDPQTE